MVTTTAMTARVIGYEPAKAFTTYTTQVTFDTCAPWTVAIRYSVFREFYTKLTALDKSFVFDFPKKGGLFSSPSPQERQPKLDAFIQKATEHVLQKQCPKPMMQLLDALLEISAHMEKQEQKKEEEENNQSEEPQATEVKVEDANNQEEEPMVEASKEEEKEMTPETHEEVAEEETSQQQEKSEEAAEGEEETAVEGKISTSEHHEEVAKEEVVQEQNEEDFVNSEEKETTKSRSETEESCCGDEKCPSATFGIATTSEDEPQARLKKPKKKKLSEAQKKLRNMRRREKRKKKASASMKISGAKARNTTEGMVTESEDESLC